MLLPGEVRLDEDAPLVFALEEEGESDARMEEVEIDDKAEEEALGEEEEWKESREEEPGGNA